MATQAEALLEKIKSLPLKRQAKVEDFVEFLGFSEAKQIFKGYLAADYNKQQAHLKNLLG